jgi:hypothetical protein
MIVVLELVTRVENIILDIFNIESIRFLVMLCDFIYRFYFVNNFFSYFVKHEPAILSDRSNFVLLSIMCISNRHAIRVSAHKKICLYVQDKKKLRY